MSAVFLKVLATLHLEDGDLLVAAVRKDGGHDRGARHKRRAKFEIAAIGDCQNISELQLLADVALHGLNLYGVACSNPILLTAGLNDCIHTNSWCADRAATARRKAADYLTAAAERQTSNLAGSPPPYNPRMTDLATPLAPAAGSGLATATLPNELWKALTPVSADMDAVDQTIRRRLKSDVALINTIADYIVAAGGKRLRPAVVMLMARALGYRGTVHIDLAAVIEFIHTATLLHDDVVDESDLRRGRSTANSAFGNAASVLVGDFLYSRSFQMMVDANSARVMQIMADATNRIAEGEVLQLLNIHDPSVNEHRYFEVVERKTAT